MPHNELPKLWDSLTPGPESSGRYLVGIRAAVRLDHLARGSCLGGRLEELRGRCVIVLTGDQLVAALAFLELDGVAARIVLAPSELTPDHLSYVLKTAGVDAIVSDLAAPRPAWQGV